MKKPLFWATLLSLVLVFAFANGSLAEINATPLTLGETAEAVITNEGEIAYFSFTPAETGLYVWRSIGDSEGNNPDTHGYLYDTQMNQLEDNDDGARNYQFKVVYTLEAGTTYYFGAGYHGSGRTGKFNVILDRYKGLISASAVQSSVTVAPESSAILEVTTATTEDPTTLTYSWSNNGSIIEGADQPSYTTESITGNAYYYCTVRDNFGNSQQVGFDIYVDNQLKVWVAGETEETHNKTVYVAPGAGVTLAVDVSAADQNDITYSWSMQERNESGGYWTGSGTIEGATTNSYTITTVDKVVAFDCYVNDRFGNYQSVRFEVYVDNQLAAYPDGETESRYKTVYVTPGADALLKVNATANDMSGVTYRWRRSVNGSGYQDYIADATEASYTAENNTERCNYECQVIDQYGNIVYNYFEIYIDNQFSAWVYGEEENVNSKAYTVAPNSDVTLKVSVSAIRAEGIAYRWSKSTIDADGNWSGSSLIDTATSDTLTISATERAEYSCIVQDLYGNSNTVYYNVYIENQLKAWAEGEEEYYSKSLTVSPGGNATMKVLVSASDMSGITYRWSKATRNADGTWNERVDISETGDTLTEEVLLYTEYVCWVKDQYGNSSNVCFYVGIENNFHAWPDEGEEHYSKELTVLPGGNATMKVNVSADDVNGITYQWRKDTRNADGSWNEWQEINETGATLTETVTAYSEYECYVRDRYGNSSNVCFYVGIENNFHAWPDEGEEHYSKELTVLPGGNATMKVNVSADDVNGITYQWRKNTGNADGSWNEWQEINETGATLTETVTAYSEYECYVRDQYGNSSNVCFYVGIENNFHAWPDEGEEHNSKELTVLPGGNATMKVNVSATDMYGITYQWRKNTRNADGSWNELQEINETGATLTEAITAYSMYECRVRDRYGNSSDVCFYVGIENSLRATVYGERELFVPINSSTTLHVNATATNAENLNYRWYQPNYDENGYWIGENVFEEAHSDTLTTPSITQATSFYCAVTDCYGNNVSVEFRVGIENNLKAWPDGEDEDDTSTRFTVELGKTATMKVNVTATDASGITYRWSKATRNADGSWNEWQEINVTGNIVNEAVSAYTEYQCRVQDRYGNTKYVYFYVGIENNLRVTVNGEQFLSVPKNGTATLQVSATANNMEGITYRWSLIKRNENGDWIGEDEIEGANTSTYVTDPITKAAEYYCRVRDCYGNENSASFNIGIENHFKAEAESETYISIQPGEPVTMKVKATADDMEGVTYRWYEGEYHQGEDYYWWSDQLIDEETSNTLAIAEINKRSMYRCEVRDAYGNKMSIHFDIYIDNRLRISSTDGNTNYAVPYGTTKELKVKTSCAKGNVELQWYKRTINEDGNWNSREIIPNATGSSFVTDNVNEYCTYICEARDSYGNDNNIWFYVSVDNKLKVRGTDNVNVPYGGEAELEVQAICKNGKLQYTWWIDGELDPEATGATYTLSNVTKYHYARCRVRDQYGNDAEAYFRIHVENHLKAYFSATVNGTPREIQTEYDMNYEEGYINTITIQPGEELTITYNASQDQGKLEYSWSDWQEGENQAADIDGNEYTPNGSVNRSIYCSVKDQYDNSVSESINVRIDNEFNAEPAVLTYQEVNEGANVTLKVAATARDGEVTYRWYKNGYSADVITSENTDEVIVKAEAGRQYYNCTVSDIYGNNTGISFEITTIVPEQLTLNQETTVAFERDNDNYSSKIYVFTPGESGIYTFTETGTHYSVHAYLNDNNGNVDCEFHETYDHVILSTELTAGTRYRLIISSYSGDDAEITIKVTKGAAEIEITDGYVLRSGQTARLPIVDAQTVTSSNTAVINANGTTVTAGQTGTARVSVTTSEGDKYLYDFMVKDGAVMNVPSALRTIEAEAFSEDEAIRFVNLSSNTKAIGAFAFNDSGLIQIVIPATDAKIAVSAFCDIRPTILCEENSLAAKMADKWGYRYLYID